MAQQTVTVTGNLIDDPFMRTSIDKKNQVTKIRIAASRSVRDKETNNWQNFDQLYINGEMWGQLAKNVKQSLRKGMPVIVTGYLVTDEWEDNKYREVTTGNALQRQQVRLRVFQIGLDLNRYIVSSRRTDVAGHTPEGMESPEPTEADDMADDTMGMPATGPATREDEYATA